MRRLIWSSIRCTSYRCWNRRLARWTRRHRCRAGTCQGSLPPCTGCWKRAWARRASANTSRFCGCLRAFEMAPRPRGYQTVAGTGRDRLRCGQASGALPDREAPATARSRYLPLPAQSTGRDHQARELYEPDDAGAGMTDTPQASAAASPKKTALAGHSWANIPNLRSNALLRRRITSSIYCGSANLN